MAFLVGSKGIGTPTWGHSLKVDPYLWSSKLSFLYDIDYLRNIESLYGNEVLKQYILEKLKAIDKFDDCLVITDFTKFTETGTNQKLQGSTSVSWEKTTDELICTFTTGSGIVEGGYAWKYVDFAEDEKKKKLFFSCVFVVDSGHLDFQVGNASGSTLRFPPDIYSVYLSTSEFGIDVESGGFITTLASKSISLTAGASYKVAGLFDVFGHAQKAWGNIDPINIGLPTLSATDDSINSIETFRFLAYTSTKSATITFKWKVPLIVAWKS